MLRAGFALLLLLLAPLSGAAQVRLGDASDRAAFRAWFVYLADAQFYRTTPDVADCAALVRHAAREAFRSHTPEWIRKANLPLVRTYPDVRARPPVTGGSLAIFRTSDGKTAAYAEFADAQTLVRLNARFVSRDPASARPGDLLYFRQAAQAMPDHLMVFVGRSAFEADGRDWVVYHTGPTPAAGNAAASAGGVRPGEVRKVRLADLVRHPAPRWRPSPDNSSFVGVFRLNWL
jgi:uncharacterized protein YfaT (DUF1175 family)